MVNIILLDSFVVPVASCILILVYFIVWPIRVLPKAMASEEGKHFDNDL